MCSAVDISDIDISTCMERVYICVLWHAEVVLNTAQRHLRVMNSKHQFRKINQNMCYYISYGSSIKPCLYKGSIICMEVV